jgi:dolichyl-phosphate-mannose--protein O-mannosyl transferase
MIFVALKVLLNMLAISRFGFHRDEFLHLVLADHLDWGYKEVPPFIAILAKITLSVFGDSVFAARIFSTIASGLIIWLTGRIAVELGGRRFAITLACLALIFSPAFAASGIPFSACSVRSAVVGAYRLVILQIPQHRRCALPVLAGRSCWLRDAYQV